MIRYCLFLTLCFASAHLLPADDVELDEPEITNVDRKHWAYLPIIRPELPEVKFRKWPNTDVDRFVLARLESESLKPMPRADRSTLLRRLHFDLIGLPPTPEQIETFLRDRRPDAYRRAVESLLASPEYGMRWGQYWLDLARFAETDGFEHDKIRPTAWKYRDWVIAAFNADLPYDQFVRQQIAGDLLTPDDPHAAIATAFCLSGPDMPDINSMVERKHVLLNEVTSTVGAALFSLQVGCAQCHDHMYDAISQADFYRLRAFFDSAVALKKNQSVTVLGSYESDETSHLMIRGDWRRVGPAVVPSTPRVVGPLSSPSELPPRVRLADWLTERANPLTARVIVNRVWQHHFGRGLSSTPSDFGVMGEEPSHPELLDYLADELIRSGWSLKRLHREIVTSAVYQTRSIRPTCSTLVRRWQAASKSDPDNRWLSRFPRRRLDAESLRDALFAVSGSLNHQLGGPGVRPPLPQELVDTLLKGQWQTSERPSDHYRRSIYLFARRNLRYPLLGTFDRPAANASCAVRSRSTTPVQALLLFNSKITLDAATRLARVVANQSDHQRRVQELYLRVFSRRATHAEIADCMTFLDEQTSLQANSEDELQPWISLCRALLNTNEFIYVD